MASRRARAGLVAVTMAAACCGFAVPAHAVDLGSAIAGAAYGVVPRKAAEPAPRPSTPPAALEMPAIAETPAPPAPQPAASAAPVAPAPVIPAPSAPMPATLPIPIAAPSPSPRVTAPAETAVAAPAPVARPWATEVAPSAPSIPPATQPSPAFVTAAPAAAWAAPAVAAPSEAQVVPAVAPATGFATGLGSWDALRAGDALEIRFYRNNARQVGRYLIQPGTSCGSTWSIIPTFHAIRSPCCPTAISPRR